MPVVCSTSRQTLAWKPYGDIEMRWFCNETNQTKVINLGQVSEANISFEIEEDSLPDYRAGQGQSAADSQITSMGLGLVMHELGNMDVLAIATLGRRRSVAADAAATQDELGYKGTSIWLDNLPTSVTSIQAKKGAAAGAWAGTNTYAVGDAVVPGTPNDLWYECSVAGDSDASEPTWPTTPGDTVVDGTATWVCMGRISLEEDTDYAVNNFGPQLADDARIWTGANNDVGIEFTTTYDHAAMNVVDAGMHSGEEYEVKFLGYNKAISDRLMLVHIFRAKSAPPDELPLIATEYAGASSTFQILSYANAQPGTSSFFTYREVAT